MHRVPHAVTHLGANAVRRTGGVHAAVYFRRWRGPDVQYVVDIDTNLEYRMLIDHPLIESLTLSLILTLTLTSFLDCIQGCRSEALIPCRAVRIRVRIRVMIRVHIRVRSKLQLGSASEFGLYN